MFFPVIVIPVFWIVYITTNHDFDTISIVFVTLYPTLTFSILIYLTTMYFSHPYEYGSNRVMDFLGAITLIPFFYAPNFLQTLLIVLKWPINFYFVKACVFILVLSLTRNVSYFTDKVPDGFLATSTTMTQCAIQSLIKKNILENDDGKGKDDSQKESTTTTENTLHNVINILHSSVLNEVRNQADNNEETVAQNIRNISELLENYMERKIQSMITK